MEAEVASDVSVEQPLMQTEENLSENNLVAKFQLEMDEVSESAKEKETISKSVVNVTAETNPSLEIVNNVENNLKCSQSDDVQQEMQWKNMPEDSCSQNRPEEIKTVEDVGATESIISDKSIDTEEIQCKEPVKLTDCTEKTTDREMEVDLEIRANENSEEAAQTVQEVDKEVISPSDSGLELNSSNDNKTLESAIVEKLVEDAGVSTVSAEVETNKVENLLENNLKENEVENLAITNTKQCEEICSRENDIKVVETNDEDGTANKENKEDAPACTEQNEEKSESKECNEEKSTSNECIEEELAGKESNKEQLSSKENIGEVLATKESNEEELLSQESHEEELANKECTEKELPSKESKEKDVAIETNKKELRVSEENNEEDLVSNENSEEVLVSKKDNAEELTGNEVNKENNGDKEIEKESSCQESVLTNSDNEQLSGDKESELTHTKNIDSESEEAGSKTNVEHLQTKEKEPSELDNKLINELEAENVPIEQPSVEDKSSEESRTEHKETEESDIESKDNEHADQVSGENNEKDDGDLESTKRKEPSDSENKDDDKEECVKMDCDSTTSGKASPIDKTAANNVRHSLSTNEEHDTEDISMEQIDCDKSITNADVDGQGEDDDISVLNDVDPIGISQDAEPDAAKDDFDTSINKEPDEKEIEDLDSGKGADEELCIIPDTERVISQEEKDAATAKRVAERDSLKAKDGVSTVGDGAAASAHAEMQVDKEGKESNEKDTEQSSTTSAADSAVAAAAVADKQKEDVAPVHFVISECSEGVRTCCQCYLVRTARYQSTHENKCSYVCDDNCLKAYKIDHPNWSMKENKEVRIKSVGLLSDNMISKLNFVRKCQECATEVSPEDYSLSWETMDFCNEDCLSKYQKSIGSKCATCQIDVRVNCLGKYCVRFGYDVRQFCSSPCLEEFKKGLKVCVYCQKDISGSSEGFLAPVGDKGQFKDFCSHTCMEKYDIMSNPRPQKYQSGTCSVCTLEKTIVIEFEHNGKLNKFCSEPCFVAFKFVNNITPGQCDMCKKYYDNKILEVNTMFYDGKQSSFCGKSCQNIYITAHRTIVACSWCKVKKYNFDMIKKTCSSGQVLMMCSVNCLSLFQVSVNAVSSKKINCDHCRKNMQAMYHLTMSDATIRNFCCYNCVMNFQNQFSKFPIRLGEGPNSDRPVPTGAPKRNSMIKHVSQNNASTTTSTANSASNLVITNVQSLAASNGPVTRSSRTYSKNSSPSPQAIKTQVVNHVIVRNNPLPLMANKFTMVKPIQHTKGINCRVQTADKEVQTDEIKEKTVLIPIPVPIYVPLPMAMFSTLFPQPFPFPFPLPVPVFIPTTRNSANGILKEMKKIQMKIPTDPYEAEVLMMAEMVAGEKKVDNTDSESDDDDNGAGDGAGADGSFSPEAVDTSNAFGEDMLQMALKMATELDEPAVDLEGALAASTITATQGADNTGTEEVTDDPQPMHGHHMMERQAMRGRKRTVRQTRQTANKRRRMSQHEIPMMQPPVPAPPPEPIEKPDANMCLKYTFGVNAWKQWVTTKNAELEKSSRRCKLFKNEILQLNSDELNYSLCLFVKEVRKPNGTEYAPDTIYYLCLGIQQYLFESGRIDNIFTDPYYEKFTECLDEVAKKFLVLYNDSHYIVTRVEEEHLWESKQLGAHSPHVLLSTLMFFNTKHFNLTTVDEHMQLSFSHIMKHWKRNHTTPGAAKVPSSRNVLLRFYPPQTTLEANTRKKKVYEQQENEDNPLRCPVKLYEFYLSKCPESVKTRNDVFYLLPERSCVPDSPVWYSTMALGKEALEKMLHRVKMVKEINVALLTS